MSFSLSPDKSINGFFKAATNANTFMRPMQNLLDAVLYFFFGLNPIGYQIANVFFLLANALLFYLLLKKIHMPRVLSVSISVIYLLLPNYSTDRFWFAAFQTNLSSLFYFLSSLTSIKTIYSQKWRANFWGGLSIVLLLLSTLSYEVIMPLYFLNAIIIGYVMVKNKSNYKGYLLTASIILANVFVFVFKSKVTTRLDSSPLHQLIFYPIYLMYLIVFSVWSNYIKMTFSLFNIWKRLSINSITSLVFILAIVLGCTVFLYIHSMFKEIETDLPSASKFKEYTSLGFLIFFLGYSIFFFNNNVSFSAGMDNRVAIVATMGVAISIIGVVGWVGRNLLSRKLFAVFFPAIIAFIGMSGFLVVNKTAIFWADSYTQQKSILGKIKNKFVSLPHDSTFILDGICPYSGPVVVFDSRWDLRGAVQLMYRDKSLKADIVTPKMQLTEDALVTKLYRFVTKYPYSNLIIYDYKSNNSYRINSYGDADKYFKSKKYDFKNSCPLEASNSENLPFLIKENFPLIKLISYEVYKLEHNKIKLYFSTPVKKFFKFV
jgi:hypothetical protein